MSLLSRPTANKPVTERKKKPDELLSSVVRETTTPAVIELLRANRPFAFPSGTAWAALLLSTEEIGGLSKRHNRDEAKGSIIELIESDQISVVATAEMLEAEVLGIIPDPNTLDRMSEFSLLTGASYGWVVFWQDETGELVAEITGKTTFDVAERVSAEQVTLQDVIDAKTWAENGGGRRLLVDPVQDELNIETTQMPIAADPESEHTVAGYDAATTTVVDDDYEEPELSFDGEGFDESESEGPGPDFDQDYTEVVETYDEALDDEEGDESEGLEAAVTVAEPAVRGTIVRRFLTDGVEMDVDLEQFHTTFSIGAPSVQIETPAADGWLGEQVTQLSRQANAGLVQLHEQELQSLYVDLMSRHIEQVSSEVAGLFKPLDAAAKAAHEARKAAADEQVIDLQKTLQKAFDDQAQGEADRAAQDAAARFRSRNKNRHERDLLEARVTVERANEAAWEHDQQQLLSARQQAAKQRLEIGRTRVNDLIRAEQTAHLAAEQQLMETWNAEILRIVDTHRKDDIARIAVLAEQQSRQDAVAILQAEQAQALNTLQAQHDDRVARMEENLSRSRQEAVDQMAVRDAEWKHSLEMEKAKTAAEAARSKDLAEQINQMDVSFRQRYDARVLELEADKRSYANELERASVIQSRSNRILTVLVVVLSLSTLVAGFILGATVRIGI